MEKKIRIAIIDDELTARNKIKKMLSGNGQYELAADFSESMAALEWIEKNPPDIVLIDMNMPKMTGIEFITMASTICPEVRYIAISGYEDFEYVRGCLTSQLVSDYILKHLLTKEVLLGALANLQKKYQIQSHRKNSQKEEAIRKIFEELEPDEEKIRRELKEEQIEMKMRDLMMFYLSPDIKKHGEKGKDQYAVNVSMALGDIVAQVLQNQHNYLLYCSDQNSVSFLVSFAEVKSYQYIINLQTTIIGRIIKMARRLLGISVSVGISNICADLTTVLKEYRELKCQVDNKLYSEGGQVYIGGSARNPSQHCYLLPRRVELQIAFELELLNEYSVREIIKKIFGDMKKVKCDIIDVRNTCSRLLDILAEAYDKKNLKAEGIKNDVHMLYEFQYLSQFSGLIEKWYKDGMEQLYEAFKERYEASVVKAVLYLNRCYCEDISLEMCCEYVGVSYTHLSRMFKKETGCRFTEYLNRLRVNKAKMLMEQNDGKMKEIISRCGFNNYNYFFKVFKEVEGISPSEYMKISKKM